MSLLFRFGGVWRVDEVPKSWVFGEDFVFGKGKLGAKGKVFEGVFVEDSMDDKAFVGFFKIDSVISRTVSVEGAVRAADGPEPIGVFVEKIGGEDIEFTEDLDLERGR